MSMAGHQSVTSGGDQVSAFTACPARPSQAHPCKSVAMRGKAHVSRTNPSRVQAVLMVQRCNRTTCTPLMQHISFVSKCAAQYTSSTRHQASLPLNFPEGKPMAESHAGRVLVRHCDTLHRTPHYKGMRDNQRHTHGCIRSWQS